jgi:hypothetical protein
MSDPITVSTVIFDDRTVGEYVRNTYQLIYKGVQYVDKEPDEILDFAHNAKARMEDGVIHILCEGKTICELVPAKTIEIPMENDEANKILFTEGDSYVEYANETYYGKLMTTFSPTKSKGRLTEEGHIEIRTRLRRGSDICLLAKEETTKKRKTDEIKEKKIKKSKADI